MEKQIVSAGSLYDWFYRLNLANDLHRLSKDLSSLFVGYEDLSYRMVCAAVEIEKLADKVLPFEIDLNS